MTQERKTIIEFLLDETGSMTSVWDQTINGFNSFIETQKTQPGECYLTLTTFDTIGIKTPYTDLPISNVPLLNRETYTPRASTNLFDAIGSRISELESRIKNQDVNVLFVIMTDGEDNSSKEYTADTIKTKINFKQENAKWSFVFLGSNQDAWKVGAQFGMLKGNTMTYDSNNVVGAMADLSHSTTLYRSATINASIQVTDFFKDKNKD